MFVINSDSSRQDWLDWACRRTRLRAYFSVKGRTSLRAKVKKPISSFSFSIGTNRPVRSPPSSTFATTKGSRSTR